MFVSAQGEPLPRALGAFTRWDAAHFLKLAEDGGHGEEEKVYAFFPFYPAVVAALSSLAGALGASTSAALHVIVAVTLNAVAFATAAVALRELTLRVTSERPFDWWIARALGMRPGRGVAYADRVASVFIWSPVGEENDAHLFFYRNYMTEYFNHLILLIVLFFSMRCMTEYLTII